MRRWSQLSTFFFFVLQDNPKTWNLNLTQTNTSCARDWKLIQSEIVVVVVDDDEGETIINYSLAFIIIFFG